ncbi:MAG: hypothetical protein ACKO6E_12515 [Planctomycetota bacterium]
MSRVKDDASSTATRSRGYTWLVVRWLISGLAVAAVAGAIALPRILGTPERITRLVTRAVPELAADVKPAGVRLGWLGPIVLENIAVVPRTGDPSPLAIRRVEVEHGLAGILLSGGDLGRVRIEGLAADLVFDRDHTSNLDAILPPDEPARKPRATGPQRAAVSLQLDVDDAVVRISGPWTSDPWISDPIDLRAALGNAADGYAAWTIEPVQLLQQAELQQTVAHEVLAYIVPVFADAARTSGRFSLRLDGATFPVGRPEEARLAGMLQMHAVELGPGPLVENMFRSLPFNLPPPPSVRIADEADVTFRLEDRRVWHDGLEFGLPLRKPGQRLDVRSQGSVGLDDRSLDLKLSLPIPADLPQDRPLVAAIAGKQVSLGVGGVLGEPKVIFDGSIKEAAGQIVVDLIDRLRNGPRPPAPVDWPQTSSEPDRDTAPAREPGPVNSVEPSGDRRSSAGGGPPQPGWNPPRSAGDPPGANAPGANAPGTTPPANNAPVADSPRQKAERLAVESAQKAGAKPDTAEAIVDLVGGVLDEVARRRAERRAAEAAPQNQPQPPRRGRLLQRRPAGPVPNE